MSLPPDEPQSLEARSWEDWAWDHLNTLAFNWRRLTGRRLPGTVWEPTPREELASPLPPERRDRGRAEVERLVAQYHLPPRLDQHPEDRLEGLCVAELTEAMLSRLPHALPHPARVLEIGPADWSYVPDLHAVLSHAGGGRDLELIGLELDPDAPGRRLPTRRAEARAAMAGLVGCRYEVGDGRDHQGGYDLVLMLFPLVMRADARAWGLPPKRFDPVGLLERAYHLVRPGGGLAIASFAYEHHELSGQLARARVPMEMTPFESALRLDREGRILGIAVKEGGKP